MKTLLLATAAMLLLGTAPAWATEDLVAYLPASGAPVTPQFKFSREITLGYADGGKLKGALEGRNLDMSFGENSDSNPSVRGLMEEINSELNGPTRITYLALNYTFVLAGGPDSASLDYAVTLTPMISGYVINKGTQTSQAILDASWMDYDIKDPVNIDSQKYGNVDINHPSDLLKSTLPDVYAVLAGTDAEGVFDKSMISSDLLSSSALDRWDILFDPSYMPGDTAGFGTNGWKVAVTTYSIGISNGPRTFPSVDKDFTGSDGVKYHITVQGGPDGAAVNVEGHANPHLILGKWTFATTLLPAFSPACCSTQWYESPLVLIGILAGAVAGFFVLYFRLFREWK